MRQKQIKQFQPESTCEELESLGQPLGTGHHPTLVLWDLAGPAYQKNITKNNVEGSFLLVNVGLTQHELHLDLCLSLHEGLDLGLEDVDALLHALGLLLDPGVDVAQLEIASLVETEGEFNDLVGIGEVGVCEVREVLVILR